MIRSLIREFLLQEEVFGAQAFVYHGSKTSPREFISILTNDRFIPGEGAGDLYGKGLYTVYDLSGTRTGYGKYGQYIYKLKMNLYGFISFEPDITRKIYKKDMTPAEQAEFLGFSKQIVDKIEKNQEIDFETEFSSQAALKCSKFLKGKVKGIIYEGEGDGPCALIYDPAVVVPVAWKIAKTFEWNKIDSNEIKSSIKRSAADEWQDQKYEFSDIQSMLRKMETLPKEKRIIRHGIWLGDETAKHVKRLPDDLTINGDLNLAMSGLEVIPKNLTVNGSLYIQNCDVKTILGGLKVKDTLIVQSRFNSIALPDNVEVGGYASLLSVASIGRNSKFGHLQLGSTKIKFLPDDLKVGTLDLSNSYIEEIPESVIITRKINVSSSKIKRLPSNFKVDGDLNLSETDLDELPENLEVGGELFIGKLKNNLIAMPRNLKVGGSLTIRSSKLQGLPEKLTVGENLTIDVKQIMTKKDLPEDCYVGKSLDISYSDINKIGRGLYVGRDASFTGTQITEIPSNTKIGKNLDIEKCKIRTLPHDLQVGRYIFGFRGNENDLPEELKLKLFQASDSWMEKVEF